jgi:hydrogenase expression/formation protein HypD
MTSFSDPLQSSKSAAELLKELKQLAPSEPIRIMNVCGGHERTISMAGLRGALPDNIELIAGPGCPVCVCPEEDIHTAIQLAGRPETIVAAFGDMLRVPCNAPKKEPRSLEQAKASGGDVRPVASPLEVMEIARNNPDKQVVFFAAGFETTIAPVAAMIASADMEGGPGLPENLSLLMSGRLTWPAVALLLGSGEPGFDALVAPGHVATTMGPEEWQFVTDEHNLPAAVAGFEVDSLLLSFMSVIRQRAEHKIALDNCYGRVVKPGGNETAQAIMRQVLRIVDANWRGIGIIKNSGFALAEKYEHLDALKRFDIDMDTERKRFGEMPPGCDCASVVLGKIKPDECKLYGAACTPRQPVGPCMVSDEGACHIWWSTGIRPPQPSDAQ